VEGPAGLLIGRLVTGVAVGLAAGTAITYLIELRPVRLATPDLAMFLIGDALIGAGSGAVFKGTTGIVLEASPPESRVAMTSALLIALYEVSRFR
jgi:MFS family permease